MSLGEVKFSDNLSPLTIQYQSKFITFNMKKAVFLPGDEFKIYMASSFENCYIPYRLGRTFQSWNLMPNGVPYFPPMWFGTKIGRACRMPVDERMQARPSAAVSRILDCVCVFIRLVDFRIKSDWGITSGVTELLR